MKKKIGTTTDVDLNVYMDMDPVTQCFNFSVGNNATERLFETPQKFAANFGNLIFNIYLDKKVGEDLSYLPIVKEYLEKFPLPSQEALDRIILHNAGLLKDI